MSKPANAADRWLMAETAGTRLLAEGPWGSAIGTLTPPAGKGSARLIGQRLLGARSAQVPIVALVVPQAPELDHSERHAVIDDALCAGLRQSGMHVARVREMALAIPAHADAQLYVDAVTDMLGAALARVAGARPALAGSWLAGAAAAAAAGRREDLCALVLVNAPAPEVMSRRTPENEDDPMWAQSPALRVADALAQLNPLEAVAAHRRPVLAIQGAVDGELPGAHLDAWRAALAYTGRPVECIELAFADHLLRPVGADGQPDEESAQALDLLAEAIARWAPR